MTNETQPTNISNNVPESTTEITAKIPVETQGKNKPNGKQGIFWIVFLIFLLLLILGSFSGYGIGVMERRGAQSTLVSQQLGEQFKLVQQDIDGQRFIVARQRLEFILQQDVSFPGATDKLAELLVLQAITPSPVPSATPTLTPTPDLRSQEAIFAQAQQQLDAKDWTGLMGSLDSLRKTDETYKTVKVDSMYYQALRSRGMDQILGSGAYKTTNMEGGIYDLTLAERFGPLDGYADGLRNFSRMYIIGASFWDVNWPQAIEYFRQVSAYAPNLRDASNVTASQRLSDALLGYGDQISQAAKFKDRCEALNYWEEANRIIPLNAVYMKKYNGLNSDCHPPTEEPAPMPVDPTPTPG